MGSRQVRVDEELVEEINQEEGKDFTTRLLNWHRRELEGGEDVLSREEVRQACVMAIEESQR